MLGAYNIDSDDDEEEEEEEEEVPTNVPKSASSHIKELEKLKEKTGELLDASWKEQRNRHLLMKMLELEEPTVTAKMVDFLLQDGVCDILLGIITQVGTNQPRPSPSDAKSEALKLSYRAVMLLTADEPTEALMAFLSKRAGVLARGIFEIYQDDSAASFYHFYRMLECLLRCFPGDVYESICSDGQMAARMRRMMRYIGYAPVGESVAMLIALTPVSRMSQLYQLSSKNRWLFFEQLSQKHFMLSLVEIIVFPEEFCYINGYINAEQHSACATFVLQELVEKLSVEETGELLLQPFGYTSKLLEHLIDTALTGSVISIRRSATKLLCFLLRRVADSDILYMVSAGGGAAPAPAYVPNRLFPLRDRIINQIFLRIKNFMQALLNSDDSNGEMDEGNFKSDTSLGPVKYSSYSVRSPFTVLRAVFLELITLMVESDDTVAELISPELWTLLIQWTLRYAHNSIYHAIFFRLVYSVLRQEQEVPQINLFLKADFTTFLIGAFVPFPVAPSGLPKKSTSEEEISKYVARGVVMNCANAIRLQVSTQQNSAFLRKHLSADEKWKEFLPTLHTATAVQHNYAFGVRVPEHNKGANMKDGNNGSSSSGFGSGDRSEEPSEGGDTGSRYARSLGFFDEPEWAISSSSVISNIGQNGHSLEEISANLNVEKKAEKSRKKKSKKKRASGNFPTSPHWPLGDAEEESSPGNNWDNNGDVEEEDSAGGGLVSAKSALTMKYENRGGGGGGSGGDGEHNILNEICLMESPSSSNSSGTSSSNKGNPHGNGNKNNGYSVNGNAKNDMDANSQSHTSSSPNKLGGSSAGNVICVTEICCDEIEVNEKVTKVANELNNLSFLADSVSERPASGSI